MKILLTFLVTLTFSLTSVSCKSALFGYSKKKNKGSKPNPTEFTIQGPTSGKVDQGLTYTQAACDTPSDIIWIVKGEERADKAASIEVSFDNEGEFTIQAKCGAKEASLTVTISEEDGGNGNGGQNQSQN